ncbi:FAD-dependent oxidoreductase [Nesterenkonia sp. CL21]|uniref:NAD(P)/FAD-dependent oxidoreductase n=1 Tax=Nesterenkonia sp. CL21 TaxID=3064894 RepID=UPI002879DF48|nr:FAD-dependent oxidoreductase [Nesterenkonia sp. CL21]MDS2172618.1 FAD-dependent oxidoreductase [Nesterenkonia sp. CL21]
MTLNTHSSQHVVVIGGGILGISVATELAIRGTPVTLLEAARIGAGTTSTSYAWVNANGKEPESYFRLNQAGLDAHRSLATPQTPWIAATGHLEIAEDEAHERDLRARAERMTSRGYAVEELTSAQAQRLEPGIIVPPSAKTIVFFPDEAHVYPHLYVAERLVQFQAHGGILREGARVTGIDRSGSPLNVLLADGSHIEADRVVLATGRWTGPLAASLGLDVPMAAHTAPGDVTVGHLVRTAPTPARLHRLVTTPWLNVRPEGGGRLLIQALDLDVSASPEAAESDRASLVPEYLSRLRTILHGTESLETAEILVGQRAMPIDGRTIAGPAPEAPDIYVVATHSGVTLAPFLGRAVAREVQGDIEPLLEDFRLTRFAEGVPVDLPRGPRKPGEQ